MFVVALAIAGCGGNAERPSGEAGATSSADEAGATSSADTKIATCSKVRPVGRDLGLTGTKLKETTDGLEITWTTKGPIRTSGTAVLYSVMASNEAGDVSRQLGVKYLDGAQIAYFVFDFGGAQQTNLEGEATVAANSVRATFPASEIAPLGERFRWRAALSVEGRDDWCPDPGTDPLNPKMLKFPA